MYKRINCRQQWLQQRWQQGLSLHNSNTHLPARSHLTLDVVSAIEMILTMMTPLPPASKMRARCSANGPGGPSAAALGSMQAKLEDTDGGYEPEGDEQGEDEAEGRRDIAYRASSCIYFTAFGSIS